MEPKNQNEPLVDKEYLLEKFPGKGGWTYASIPEVPLQKNSPFGWAKVRGSIDDYELKAYKLMPMGNGSLFLPVKAAIRKKIKKEAGDWIKVILYADELPIDIPEEIKLCLNDAPEAKQFFDRLTEGEQKVYLDWIYSAKKEETKVERIVKMIERLTEGLKYYD